ncbi:retrotransposon protein, putative, ty1-copia subclass [Tanacetum coccineum]|uniref:Retrotransposon protein, putative, ty1-copia subclass n=1 Tax=Tanacetum coccineum TaxID=301880 RepID=A0ABQ5AEY8_9ASTR
MQLTLVAYLLPYLFTRWIVLSVEDKLDYLEQPIPPAPVPAQASQQVAPEALAAHTAWVKGSKEIDGFMLMTMEPDIQQNLENLSAYDMFQELKTLFAQQAEHELLRLYIDNLERLGHPVSLNLGVILILISLRKEFDSFVQNYNMHNMGKTVNELHVMLKLHEQTLPKKDLALHVIRAGKYLAELLKNKKLSQRASGSGYVGNGQRAEVEAIKTYHLCLPNGLVIVLNNCHFAPSITRGIISLSRLYDNGYVNHFVDNTISVSRNNMVYFSVIPRDDIFEIDLSNSNTNNSYMYVLSNKTAKLNLDSALLWHCRLGHISKKCIEKLQHDGLLNSTNLRAFKKYVSCMSGKMARKPYTHQVERAKDLLGLIHTDVCGSFRTMSRQGASYFFTFTDDFSHYGYVYLLKHKHEVFETFNAFQKKVENQLGKTIKSLCFDRGGKYMSQKFLDHLKEHGIIAHRTPPFTPQHNGVSERRNRTLLDIVPPL